MIAPIERVLTQMTPEWPRTCGRDCGHPMCTHAREQWFRRCCECDERIAAGERLIEHRNPSGALVYQRHVICPPSNRRSPEPAAGNQAYPASGGGRPATSAIESEAVS